jgi:hypothetical protein
MRSPCCLCQYSSYFFKNEAYGVTLLSVPMYLRYFFVFYAVRVVSKEIRRLVLPRTSYYISVLPKTTPEFRKLFGSAMYKVLFYPVRLPTKNRRVPKNLPKLKNVSLLLLHCVFGPGG